MENPDYYDEEDQIEDNIEKQQEAIEDYVEDSSPTYSEKEDLYSLFWKVINKKDSSKLGNLDKFEIGMLNMSVRDCQNIAVICDIVNYREVAKWLRKQAEIILATSVSRKGFLLELFVSAKRYSSKEKRLGVQEKTQTQQKQTFWDRFRKK